MVEGGFFEGLDEIRDRLKGKAGEEIPGLAASPAADRLLYDVIRRIHAYTLDLGDTLKGIVDSTVTLARAERGAVFLLEGRDELVVRANRDLAFETLPEEERKRIRDLVDASVQSGQIKSGVETVASGRGQRQVFSIAVPLRVDLGEERRGGRERRRLLPPTPRLTIGAVYAEAPAERRSERRNLEPVLSVLAQQATAAVVNAQFHAQATTDPLTHLYNRAYLEQCIANEIRFGAESGMPLSLVMMDVDFFRLVNDRFGPEAGDRALREVGAMIRRTVRDSDLVARYGGEAFAIVLPYTDGEAARRVADKIRTAVGEREIAGLGTTVTLSAGVASYPGDAATREELVRKADQALYRAKQEGKDRVCSWEPSMGEFARRADPLAGLLVGDTATDHRNFQLLLEAMSIVNSTIDLDDLLLLVVDMMIDITRAERGILMLTGAEGNLEIRLARDNLNNTLERVTFFSHSIPKKVVETGAPVWILDTMAEDTIASATSSIQKLQLHTVMCVPLEARDRIIGVIYVDSRSASTQRDFKESDFTFFYALARQASVAIENARLLEDNRARQAEIERLNKQLEKKLEITERELVEVSEDLRETRREVVLKYRYDNIVGQSRQMQEVFRLLDKVTDSDVPVLIHGENGTGKELIAKAIHYNGPLREQRIICENCAAIAETLLESELFGHVRGAFSGADKDKKGLFELANQGTLFLDEIGEMTLDMQKKLLRVIQEGEIRPVGGNEIIQVRVRIISATNRDLREMVGEGTFREDLYYRLNVVNIKIPPLRERRDDIPPLVEHFLEAYAEERGVEAPVIAPDAMKILANYDWPGNVRELQNQIRKVCALGGAVIGPEMFADLTSSRGTVATGAATPLALRPLRDIEKEAIFATLEAVGWNKVEAAKRLAIDRTTLYNKIDKFKLVPSSG